MEKREKVVGILIYLYFVPLMVLMILLSLQSLFKTTYFELYKVVEAPYYKRDHPLIIIILTVLLLVFLGILLKKQRLFFRESVKCRNWYLLTAAGISLLFVLIFRGTATADSMALSNIAVDLLGGNGGDFTSGYLAVYPFQIGMVAFLQGMWGIFGNENFIVFQLINVAAIVIIIYLINRITEELFADKEVNRFAEILSAAMLPLFLYATFIYGDIIGLAFSTGAIFCVIRFIKHNSYVNLIWTILLIAVATLFKSNNNVILVAIVIALLLKWIQDKPTLKESICIFAGIAGVILLPQVFYKILSTIYCMVYNLGEMPKGAPKILWMAMSLQEEVPFEYGWYNGFNWNTYTESGLNQEVSKAVAMTSIRESLQNFIDRPRFAITFFYRKLISQWNAPCFQSLITNEWSSRHSENLSGVANTLLYGIGRRILLQLMNFYHFIIYTCVSVCFVKIRKKVRLEQGFLILCIFGGILFHLIWEAQARYALPYFVLMLPLAAKGMNEMVKFKLSLFKSNK